MPRARGGWHNGRLHQGEATTLPKRQPQSPAEALYELEILAYIYGRFNPAEPQLS